MKTVVGLYDRREDARDVIQALVDANFPRDRISMATQSEEGEDIDLRRSDTVREYDADKDVKRERDRSAGTESGEGAAIGGAVGAIMGGVGGLLVGLGTLVIPGLGVIAAAGPLVGLLSGAVAGGVAGGLLGALIGLGIPEEEARVYTEGVRRGGTLVVVQTEEERVSEAQSIMERFDPVNIEQRAETWRQEGWDGGAAYPHEERRHEEGRDAHRQAEHDRRRREEELQAEMRGDREHPRGDRTQHQPSVRTDEATLAGSMGRMDEAIDRYMQEHEHEFRRHYETELADTGRDFSYFRPAYMYGCKLAHADQFSDQEWQEIEAEARRRWRETNDDESWHMVEDAVRTSYRSCRR